jgi:hypothetical protein
MLPNHRETPHHADMGDVETTGAPTTSFDLLARLTAQLASTARLDEMVDTVLGQIVELGFGAAWMAVLDEPSGHLHTLKEVSTASTRRTRCRRSSCSIRASRSAAAFASSG